MAETISFLGRDIEIRRRAFQKRTGLTVYPNGMVRVSTNKTTSRAQILSFLSAKQRWLEARLQESEQLKGKYPTKKFKSGESFPYLGRQYRLQIIKGEHPYLRFFENELFYQHPLLERDWSDEFRERQFSAFKRSYRQVAEQLIRARTQHWAEKMQLFPTGVVVRDQKSIWGSCSAKNKISINFKLIVAPLWVIDYVVIHELAHIVRKDHSKQFWSVVEQYTSRRHDSRDWLREHHFETDFLSKKPELQA